MRIHHPSAHIRSRQSFLNSLVQGTRSPLILGNSSRPQPPETQMESPVRPFVPAMIDCPSISNAIDVHRFDGHWQLPATFPRYTQHEQRSLYAWALERLPQSDGLRMVINDTGSRANYDDRSGAMACDLLTAILARGKELQADVQQDMFHQLELQMHDSWTTGRCPQGRTTRLYQIWLALPSP